MDLAACIKGAEHACFIHTRGGGGETTKNTGVCFYLMIPVEGEGECVGAEELVGIPEHLLAGEGRRRAYSYCCCVALRAMKMISKMIPHTSAMMFSILAVLEASEATVLSPTALAF